MASPVTFTVVRSMSSGLSMASISAKPSVGKPTEFKTIISITIPAPGTPAEPIEASVAVISMVSSWTKVSSTPKTSAIKTVATAW